MSRPLEGVLRRRDLPALLLILFIAAWMRLGRGGVVEYFHDDAMLATLALEMTDGGPLPLTGILSSTGIPNPPTGVYLMAIPFSLSSNPNTALHFIMLLNVGGVGLLWGLAHRCFGRRTALIAGLAYAINPWAVLFSRKIWAQDFHTPLILLGLILLLYGFWEKGRRRWATILAQGLSLPLLLFAFQIHFAAWALLPLIPFVLWLGRKRITRLGLTLAALLSLLALLPYMMGLSRTLQADPTRISDAWQRSSSEARLNGESMAAAMSLAAGLGLESYLAPDQPGHLSAGYPPFSQAGLAWLLLMFGGVYIGIRKSWRLTVLLALWAFLPPLLLLYEWTTLHIHYFVPSLPALALFIGIGLDGALARLNGRRAWLLWIAAFLIFGLQILQWQAALDYVEDQHIDYPGFTTPLGALNPLRERLRQAEDVLMLSQGMAWNLHHEVAVWSTLLWDDVPCVRTLAGDGYAVFPAHPFLAAAAPDAPPNPIRRLYSKDDPLVFKTRKGGRDYIVYEWESAPIWKGIPVQPIPPILFDNDVQLSGYGLGDDQVILEWRLPGKRVGLNYQFTAQLFDDDGHRLAQLDATFWHGRHWCEGDRLLTWGPLPADAAADRLKVAMYRLGAGKDKGQYVNAHVLDALGNPSGQSIDIQLEHSG